MSSFDRIKSALGFGPTKAVRDDPAGLGGSEHLALLAELNAKGPSLGASLLLS
jgi:hypothetical protein